MRLEHVKIFKRVERLVEGLWAGELLARSRELRDDLGRPCHLRVKLKAVGHPTRRAGLGDALRNRNVVRVGKHAIAVDDEQLAATNVKTDDEAPRRACRLATTPVPGAQ